MTVVVAMMAVVTLAGCGGSDNDEASTTPTTEEELNRSRAGGEFCELIQTYGTTLTGIASAGANTDQVRQFADEITGAIRSAEDAAPAEIKPDVTVVAAAAENYLAALRDAGYDLAKLPPEAAQAFQAPDVAEAAVRLQGYAASVCGFRN